MELDGYVLKKDSPSCGMERVKVYPDAGVPSKDGRGLFAEALIARLPDLPVEEEGRLNDPPLRENFIARVFVHHRWREGEREGWTRAGLMRFHERHKFLLLARNQAGMRRLGRLLGEAGKDVPADELAAAYRAGLTEILRRPATRRGHTNVLHHLAGFVSDALDGADRAELARDDRALPAGAGAADRAPHPDPPSRPAAGGGLSSGAGLSGAAPLRADAAEPRVGERRTTPLHGS